MNSNNLTMLVRGLPSMNFLNLFIRYVLHKCYVLLLAVLLDCRCVYILLCR